MMITCYRTLAKASQAVYKEKGSKFLAFACPAGSIEQVQEQLEEFKRKHHKARHHCYAYILGHDGSDFRAFDDGEPKHSAGDPILGQLRSYEVVNILVIVVRYFGGTKLGIGGLVNAYREAARSALKEATIIEKELFEIWHLTFPYSGMKQVMNLVKELDLHITKKTFKEYCKLTLQVPVTIISQARDRAASISELKIES